MDWFWTILGVLAVPLLVLINALFVAAEFSLVSVRRTRVEEMVKSRRTGAVAVLGVLDHLDDAIAATQLGITLASLALGWIGEPCLARSVQPALVFLPGKWSVAASHGLATAVSFLLITVLHVILGEFTPKAMALQRPDTFSLWLAQPLLWKQRPTGALIVTSVRERAWTPEEQSFLTTIAHAASAAVANAQAALRGLLAQEIHHRVKNNLQTVASLLRLQARATDVIDPREALEHSVNRILAIAAVHELLTERREEDVELADLIDRLRAMLVQGVGGEKEVSAELEPVSLSGSRATALALVFAELLQNALEHGGDCVRVQLAKRNGDIVLAIADDGAGVGEAAPGTGLSIVQALVRDELRGTLDLSSVGGTRAEVVFPA